MRRANSAVCFTVLLVCTAALAGQVDFETQIQPIFDDNCIVCHGANPLGDLDLTQGVSFDNLVGVPSPNYSPSVLADDGDLTGSVLYNKVNDTNDYGDVMPPGGRMLQADIDLIAVWISQLACNGDTDGDGRIGLQEAIHALQVVAGLR